jgi:hypothetical protein
MGSKTTNINFTIARPIGKKAIITTVRVFIKNSESMIGWVARFILRMLVSISNAQKVMSATVHL